MIGNQRWCCGKRGPPRPMAQARGPASLSALPNVETPAEGNRRADLTGRKRSDRRLKSGRRGWYTASLRLIFLRASPHVPGAASQDPNGEQGVSGGVRDHGVANSSSKEKHCRIEYARRYPGKPPVAMHEAEGNGGRQN
jgi:hypothetical protein